MFYLIVLCLAEPLDVFKRMEPTKWKRTSEKEQTGHTRRCIKGTVRNAVVPLDRCFVELMGVQRPFTLGVTHLPWVSLQLQRSQAERVRHISLVSCSSISRESMSCQEMARFSASSTSTVLEHQVYICQTHHAMDVLWHITVQAGLL